MKVAVVDDLSEERNEIINLVRHFFSTQYSMTPDFEEFESGEAFLKAFAPRKYELVLLDIYMSKMTGIETAEKLRVLDKNCKVIFFTSSVDHMLDGYGVQALGYVLKPVSENKKALHKALDFFADFINVDKIEIKVKLLSGDKFVLNKSIVYVESSVRSLYLHFSAETIKLSGKYSDYASVLLQDERFIEPYRNLIVNMDFIEKPMDQDFILKTGIRIPISRRRRTESLEQYTHYLIKRRI